MTMDTIMGADNDILTQGGQSSISSRIASDQINGSDIGLRGWTLEFPSDPDAVSNLPFGI